MNSIRGAGCDGIRAFNRMRWAPRAWFRPGTAMVAMIGAVLFTTVVEACPNCRDAMAGDPAQAGLVRGFFWSIVFMLSMPFLIFGGLSSYFYWEVCRARRAAAEAAARAGIQTPFAASGSRPHEEIGREGTTAVVDAAAGLEPVA